MKTGAVWDFDPRFGKRDAGVPKLWPDCTMVLLGGGPSLTSDDVEYVCEARERNETVRVLAIKESYLIAPWADVLYAADENWWRFYNGAPTFTGLKYSIEDWPMGSEHYKPAAIATRRRMYPDVPLLRNTGDGGLEIEPIGLRTGHNSGYQAINLAVHFGATRVLLLGYDCWAGPDGRQNWHTTKRPHLTSPYPVFLQSFGTMVEPLRAAGVQVINCSRFTVLRAFPRQSLEEAL